MKNVKKVLALLLSLAMIFGTLTVTAFAADNEAKIGSTEYATLDAAMKAAKNGDEVELLKDVTVSARIELAAKAAATAYGFTFNMAGKRVTYTGEKAGFLLVRGYTTVTVTGNGEVKNDSVDSTHYFATNNNASLIVENGTFTGAAGLSYTSYTNTVSIKGGTWDIDPTKQMTTGSTPKEYSAVPSPYIATPNDPVSPTSWTVEMDPSVKPVVELDGKQYFSFAEALAVVNAASSAKTIKILEDFEVGNLGQLDEGKELILDLNGKTITCTDEFDGQSTAGIKLLKSKMTIDDKSEGKAGKLVSTGGIGNNGFIYVNNTGALLTLNAGTIEAKSDEGSVVWTSGSKSANIVVNGGTITNTGDGFSIGVTSSYTPSVEINGGTFNGSFETGTASSFVVAGGLFNFNPEDLSVNIAGEVVDNEDGTWTVIPKVFAELSANGEKVGEYTSFNAAVMAGYNNYTDDEEIVVTLLDDAETGGGMDLSTKAVKGADGKWTYYAPDITINLNNKTLTVTGSQLFKLKAKMTIDDFSEDKGGVIEAITAAPASTGLFYLNSGRDFVLNNGAILAESFTSGKYLINSSGFIEDIYINGGKLDAGEGYSIRTNTSENNIVITGGTIFGEINPGTKTTTTITAGIYNWDPSEYINTDVYEAVEDTPEFGLFTVGIRSDLPEIVSFNGANYKTVTQAVQAVLETPEKTGTIAFLDDAVIVEGTISISDADANITFDFGGYTVVEKNANQIFYFKNGTFTLKNGTIIPGGQIATSGQIRINNGILTVKDIVFDGDKTQTGILTNINSKNGGAFYIYGSDVTFDNTTIKNCLVKDMSAMTGNSGAIHIVKQSVEQVSNVEFNNSKIENCQAAVQGGAVSVGSGCTFHMDAASSISNCKAMMGGAIYVDIADSDNFPAQTDFLCGEVRLEDSIKNLITDCASTGDIAAPIVSNGFVYEVDVIKTTDEVYQRQTVAAVGNASLRLHSNLDVLIGFDLAIQTGVDLSGLKAKVVIEGEEQYIDIGNFSGSRAFEIEDLPMSMMASPIEVQIGGGEDIFYSNPLTTSVVDYAERAHTEDSENVVLANLLADMLKLGSEVQKYWQTGTAFDVADTLLADYVTDRAITAADSVKKTTVSASDQTNYRITKAAINVLDKLRPFFLIYTTDATAKVVLKAGGEEERFPVSELDTVKGVDNTYRLELGSFSPIEYYFSYSISLEKADGTVLHEATYSIYSYCYAMRNSEIADLALAIFRAGKSAEAYVPSDG